jgi:hypothetical protein
MDFAAALEDAEDRDLAGCAAPAFALANAAKIALIDLDEPFDRQAILQLPSDNLTQPMKEIGGRLAVDAGQICRAPSRHACDKKLRQSILRLFLQTTAPYPLSLILDPLPIWDSPLIFIRFTGPRPTRTLRRRSRRTPIRPGIEADWSAASYRGSAPGSRLGRWRFEEERCEAPLRLDGGLSRRKAPPAKICAIS